MEILAGAIVAGAIAAIFAIRTFFRSKQKQDERKGNSYEDIATKWYLWDEFVNCYYINGLGKVVEPADPMKAEYMDYDTFFSRSKDEKLQMLRDEFGEEKT